MQQEKHESDWKGGTEDRMTHSGTYKRNHLWNREKRQDPSGASAFCADQSGSAMIIVICVMMVVTAVSLALLLGASLLSATSRKTYVNAQTRIMATTMSRQIESQLVDKTYDNPPDGTLVNTSGDLWGYVGSFVCERNNSWWYYEAGSFGHKLSEVKRTFTMEPTNGWPESQAGKMSVSLYWVNESGETFSGYDVNWKTYFENVDIILYVETTCELQGESCTITTAYSKTSEAGNGRWKWSPYVERSAAGDEG